jgi:transposase
VTGKWDSTKLLGAVSAAGETFFLPCEENLLDNASYFTANAVQEFVEDTPIELCYLPRGSPELNPTEECWRKLTQALGNRLFETLTELQDAALFALKNLESPEIFTYLCL